MPPSCHGLVMIDRVRLSWKLGRLLDGKKEVLMVKIMTTYDL